jgi:hypothetical protein
MYIIYLLVCMLRRLRHGNQNTPFALLYLTTETYTDLADKIVKKATWFLENLTVFCTSSIYVKGMINNLIDIFEFASGTMLIAMAPGLR